MHARLYGSGKIVPDNDYVDHYKKLGFSSKVYKYSAILKINDDGALGDIYFRTTLDKNFKIIGGGSGGSVNHQQKVDIRH